MEDRGKGFVRNSSSKGVGLFSMEERAKSIGGKLTINSELGEGSTVTLMVPMK
ncbi:ATP-binding protein [Paenibacillus sp. TAF58]